MKHEVYIPKVGDFIKTLDNWSGDSDNVLKEGNIYKVTDIRDRVRVFAFKVEGKNPYFEWYSCSKDRMFPTIKPATAIEVAQWKLENET